MTEEEYFRKHYPDVCYNGKPLSPYWDLFQDGTEFGERQSEKKIEELEQENARLKEKLEGTEKARDYWKDSSFDWRHKCTSRKPFRVAVKAQKQLIKAIGIIKRWYETNNSTYIEPSQELIEVTEQFLKEIEK
mgnify:CR=1 FL=1